MRETRIGEVCLSVVKNSKKRMRTRRKNWWIRVEGLSQKEPDNLAGARHRLIASNDDDEERESVEDEGRCEARIVYVSEK